MRSFPPSLGSLYTALHKKLRHNCTRTEHQNSSCTEQLSIALQHGNESERNTTRSNTVFQFLLLPSHFLSFFYCLLEAWVFSAYRRWTEFINFYISRFFFFTFYRVRYHWGWELSTCFFHGLVYGGAFLVEPGWPAGFFEQQRATAGGLLAGDGAGGRTRTKLHCTVPPFNCT